jgi:hypothetical protein
MWTGALCYQRAIAGRLDCVENRRLEDRSLAIQSSQFRTRRQEPSPTHWLTACCGALARQRHGPLRSGRREQCYWGAIVSLVRPIASNCAWAFCSDSRHSRCGLLSATMPAPTCPHTVCKPSCGWIRSHQQRADQNIQVQMAAPVQIATGAVEQAAPPGFQRFDDFHAADFGASR